MLDRIKQFYYSLFSSEKGQDLTEYGLLVALIAIVVLLAVVVFGGNVSTFFSALASEVEDWVDLLPS